MTRFIILLSVFCLLINVSARADDDMKHLIGGIAAGVIGLALENAVNAEEEQEEAETIAAPVSSSQSSKPKLQYDADVAEVQQKLKRAGIYNGAVDGLKGQDTSNAIQYFERVHPSMSCKHALYNHGGDQGLILSR